MIDNHRSRILSILIQEDWESLNLLLEELNAGDNRVNFRYIKEEPVEKVLNGKYQISFAGKTLGWVEFHHQPSSIFASHFLILLISVMLIFLFIVLLTFSRFKKMIDEQVVQPLTNLSDSLESIPHISKLSFSNNNADCTEIETIRTAILDLSRKTDKAHAKLTNLERQAAIGKLAAMLAHDVRKPFDLIKIMFMLLKRSTKMEAIREHIRSFSDEIDKTVNSLESLVQDVMAFGSDAKPTPRIVDPTQWVKDNLAFCTKIKGNSDLRVTCSFSHKKYGLFDPQKMNRAFSNILFNAFDATSGSDPSVWIKTSELTIKDQPMLMFTIGNTGSYISPTDRDHVFDMFFSKDKPNGTGLGLAIAKKVTSENGGEITCSSDDLNGTEFQIILPSAEKQVQYL
ncbi:MAG: PAS domain-containing sensor histidine kinase [Oligoflexales bacterium]